MWGLSTSDKIALVGVTGTVLAAFFTAGAVFYAAKSANASRDTARIMRDQWKQDQQDRTMKELHRAVALLSSLRDECRVIKYTFTEGSQAHLGMPEWAKSRTEVAYIDSLLATKMRELEMRIDRHNQVNAMNERMVLEPQRARILAAAATAKNREEISENHTAMVQKMIQDAKAGYLPTMPLLDATIEQLNNTYADIIKYQEAQTAVKQS